jgi:DMSO/TMAO reductase YedYZ molybdopterin-dependent catalytic subunit
MTTQDSNEQDTNERDTTSGLRSTWVAARLGALLGIAITVCFLTGLCSHWLQHPPGWFVWPTHPVWLFELTQGVHVATGVAAIPLTLLKLAVVYPKLFERPVLGSLRDPVRFAARLIDRASVAVLVPAMLFQLMTGLLNIAQWYPWKFFFTTTHYAMAWVVVGAVLVHLAVKLPEVITAFRRTVAAAPSEGADGAGVSRRAVLVAGLGAAALAAVTVGGQSVPALHRLALLSPRSGRGPQGLPVNRTAAAAGVAAAALAPDFRLTVAGVRTVELSLAQLRGLPQRTVRLPIACVEGWSQWATWTGVRVRDLAELAGAHGSDLRFVSIEDGPYGVSTLPTNAAAADDSLLALELDGAELDLDHGYPCRLIAPARSGVLQTKWVRRIEVVA